jgi:hypothetical protein
MYDVVSRLYKNGKIDNNYLDIAISLEWITEEQKQEIVSTS